MKNLKIRSIIGLALIYAAVFLELQWIWGVLFLLWVLPDLFNGITFFIEPVERKENPLLYWAITVSWLWMSVYIIATPFIPALSGYPQTVKHSTQQVGIYEDVPAKVVKLDSQPVSANRQKEARIPKTSPTSNVLKDTLAYRLFEQTEAYTFVGISATVNEYDENLDRHIEELWVYFYENDISTVIPNIVDERIYVLYGKSDKEGTFEACLAYRTDGLQNLHEGLTGITVPAGKFAVFQKEGKEAERFVAKTWEQIYSSDLDANQGYNLEVYTLDAAYEVQKAEIRVSIKLNQ